MKVLFLTPYPHNTAASQRFRYEQYLSDLESKGVKCDLEPFWEVNAWKVLYGKGSSWSKLFFLLKGIIRRWMMLVRLRKYDTIFIHREIYPTGVLLLPWLIHKVFKGNIVYDFDDAIWLPNFADNNKRFAFIKSYTQVPVLCRYASVVSVGNAYLKDYALQFNDKVVINPTTIDTDNYHNELVDHSSFGKVVFGWTGTHSTLKYMHDLLPMFDDLYSKYRFELLIISDKTPGFERSYLKFVPWNKSTEIEDLRRMNVGVMPLTDDKWSKGKCGFKALQYMSIGVPAIVSPIGVNTDIVDHDVNGWICDSVEDWKNICESILSNNVNLVKMGASARKSIEAHFSVKSNLENFYNIIRG